jgi:hypothetical protein
VPEDRGRQERENYAATLLHDYDNFAALADTDEKREDLEREFTRYRAGFRQHYVAMLAAKSRTVSTMITGRSNFNVRRAEKSSSGADKRLKELIDYRVRAVAAIRKVLRPEDRPIMSSDDDATDRLEDKIAKAERLQAMMKAANAAIRKAKSNSEAIAALATLGFRESIARELLEPDFAGRIGFPAFELTNNNANIRRMKDRLIGIERNQATPEVSAEGVNARLEDSPAENRVRLYFPGKPSVEVRTRLKSRGFRWSPTIGAWQAYRNPASLELARQIAGV